MSTATQTPAGERIGAQLRAISRSSRVLTDRHELHAYDCDALTLYHNPPDAVVIPDSADEVPKILRLLKDTGTPCVMRGGGTSLSGGPVTAQGGVVVHLSRLRKILKIDKEDMYCEVEAGIILNDLNRELATHGLYYPPDPSSAPTCTLGGNVAENAGGAHCFRYGVTGQYVLGMEAVLADGTVRRFGGPAGGLQNDICDWRSLMVGSEGLLAGFTKFWLRLVPLPGNVATLCGAFPTMSAAINCVLDIVRHHSIPAAIEFMDSRSVNLIEDSSSKVGLRRDSSLIIVEIDGPEMVPANAAREIEEIMHAHQALDIKATTNAEDRAKIWKARKGAGGLLGQVSPDLLVQDAVLPRTRLLEFLEDVYRDADAADVPVMCFFHAGDGNVHPNYLFDARDHAQVEKIEELSKYGMLRVIELGGILSGEHGIGLDKMKYMKLLYTPAEIALQFGVATTFNADHRMNPGKVLEGRNYQKAQ